jgi:hypothetical protein
MPLKVFRLSEIHLNEINIGAYICNHWSDVLPFQIVVKHGAALSPLHFNFAVEYVRKVKKIWRDQNLNGACQLLLFADDGNIWSENINRVKKK